jgi:hypothetical protein
MTGSAGLSGAARWRAGSSLHSDLARMPLQAITPSKVKDLRPRSRHSQGISVTSAWS